MNDTPRDAKLAYKIRLLLSRITLLLRLFKVYQRPFLSLELAKVPYVLLRIVKDRKFH